MFLSRRGVAYGVDGGSVGVGSGVGRSETLKCSLFPHESRVESFFSLLSKFASNNKNILMRLPLDGTFIALRRLGSLERMSRKKLLSAALRRGGERLTGVGGAGEYFHHNHQFLLHSGLHFSLPQPPIKSSYLLRMPEYESVGSMIFYLL